MRRLGQPTANFTTSFWTGKSSRQGVGAVWCPDGLCFSITERRWKTFSTKDGFEGTRGYAQTNSRSSPRSSGRSTRKTRPRFAMSFASERRAREHPTNRLGERLVGELCLRPALLRRQRQLHLLRRARSVPVERRPRELELGTDHH